MKAQMVMGRLGTLSRSRNGQAGHGARLWIYLLVLGVGLAMAVQAPFLWRDWTARLVLYACWVGIAAALVLTTRLEVNRTLTWLGACLLAFDAFCVLGQVVLGRPYLSSSLLQVVNVSMTVFAVGYLLSRRLNENEMIPIVLTYIALAVALAIYVYFDSFYGVQSSASAGYLYSGKNSLGVIAVASAISVLSLSKYVGRYRIAACVVSAFLLWFVFLLQNRASLVAIVVMLGWTAMRRSLKAGVAVLALAVVVLLWLALAPGAPAFLRSALLLDLLKGGDLDAWSSGRLDLASAGLRAFLGSPLVGVGQLYVENFQLSALAQYGAIGTAPLLGLVAITLGSGAARERRVTWIGTAVTYLWLLMLTVSIFEELAPFGPGVRSLLLWLLSGYLVGQRGASREDLSRGEAKGGTVG